MGGFGAPLLCLYLSVFETSPKSRCPSPREDSSSCAPLNMRFVAGFTGVDRHSQFLLTTRCCYCVCIAPPPVLQTHKHTYRECESTWSRKRYPFQEG